MMDGRVSWRLAGPVLATMLTALAGMGQKLIEQSSELGRAEGQVAVCKQVIEQSARVTASLLGE